jgi:hypothetical protein
MKLSRRRFLGGAGAMISLPLLESIIPRSARAAAATPMKRFVGFYIPCGIEMSGWTPSQVGPNWQMTEILTPLQPYKKYVNVLTGLNNVPGRSENGGDHAAGTASFLTCAHAKKTAGADIRNGISADQLLAPILSKDRRFPSLELGVDGGAGVGDCDTGYSCSYVRNIAWSDAVTPVPKQVNPSDVFDRMFSGFDPNQSAAEKAKRLMYKKSVLDYAVRDADSLRLKLGNTDQKKLDEYLTSVRELEMRLTRPDTQSQCTAGTAPRGDLEFADRTTAMIDLIGLAFACDITRVITFMMGNGGSYNSHPQIGISEAHHELSHHKGNADNLTKLRQINAWEIGQLARLLDKMTKIQDSADANALDNSIVYLSSEIEDGDSHSHDNMPVLIAGGGGGTISSGEHRRYQNQPLGNLFVSMLTGLGKPVNTFGDGSAKLPNILK